MPAGLRLPRFFARFACDRSGHIAVTSAIFLPIACVLAALAVDEGAIFAERRNMQGLTDLAAIAAASTPADAGEAALDTFRDNGMVAVLEAGGRTASSSDMTGTVAKVEAGRYDSRSGVAIDQRFTAGFRPANSFRVTLTKTARQYFSGGLLPPPRMQTVATAYSPAEASFSVGSRLANLDGGTANAVLGSLLGAQVSLSVMDYNSLANARVDVPTLLGWTAKSLDLKAVSFSDLLQTDLPLKSFLVTLATLPDLDKAAAAPLRAVASTSSKQKRVKLGDLFDLGPSVGRLPIGQASAGIAASAAAGDILGAAAALANRRSQVEVGLTGNYPGIANATLHLAIGEPVQASPWIGSGERGTVVRTAQTRALLVLNLGGPGGVLGTVIKLPIYAEAATAEAKLAGIRCQSGKTQPTSVSLDVTPGLAELRVADVDLASLSDFKAGPRYAPATLVKMPLVSATASAFTSLSDGSATRISFSTREIAEGAAKSVASRGFVSAPVDSLMESLKLDVNVLGLGAGLPSVLGATLDKTLNAAAKPADLLLGSVLATLGISLGQADVTVTGGACRRAVLVQ